MPYCTLDDILGSIDEADVIAYTDEFDSGVINQDTVDKAIARADAMIESYLARRYLVPMDPVPDMVRDLAVDIAVYRICSHKSDAPDDRRRDYDDAVKQLKEIAAGKAVIPEAAASASGASGNTVVMSSQPRKFSRDSLKGF